MGGIQNPENYWYLRRLQRGGEPMLAGPMFRPKLFASVFGDEALVLFERYTNAIGNVSDEEIQTAREAFSQKVGFDPDGVYRFLPFRDKIPEIAEDEIIE